MAFHKWVFPINDTIHEYAVRLDKAGRVVIPKPLRDELQLAAGDSLALEFDGERMTLRPLRSASALRKEHGIWVFRGRNGPGARESAATA